MYPSGNIHVQPKGRDLVGQSARGPSSRQGVGPRIPRLYLLGYRGIFASYSWVCMGIYLSIYLSIYLENSRYAWYILLCIHI